MTVPLSFSRPFDTRRLGTAAMAEVIVADAAERTALAADLGILGIESLAVDLVITAWKRIGVRIEGRLRADVVQACVVSLEPVAQAIDQPFIRHYLPPTAANPDPKTVAEAEVIVRFDEEDPPDPLVGHGIDLGAVAAEELVLALDPYPRAPGATLAEESGEDRAEGDSPFAALSRLRDKK